MALETQAPLLPEIVIEPIRGWIPINFREIWAYRTMMYFLVLRQLKAAYQQSILGPLWIIINSILSVVIYSFLFGEVAKLPSDGVPYPLFTFTAMMLWTLISSTVANTTTSMSVNGIYKKVYFPRLTIPLVELINNLVNYTLSAVILVLMLLGYGYTPNWGGLLALPLFVLLGLMLGLGIGLAAAPLDVRSRDTRHIVNYLIRFGFYAAPIVYARSVLPSPYDQIVALNPFTPLIEGYRWSILGGTAPEPSAVGLTAGIAVVVLYLGLLIFKRNEKDFADLS